MKIEDEVIEQLRALPEDQKPKVLHYVRSLAAAARHAEHARRDERARASMQWIDEHRAEYAGRWVALDGDRLVAAGSNARGVYEEARRQGVEVPFVDQVEGEQEGAYWGGWL